MRKSLLLAFLMTVAIGLNAQEDTRYLGEYVVTATRNETPIVKSGKTIYKITAEEIRKLPGRTVADLLNSMPGIHIDGAFGTPGTNLSYNIRGGRNRHTLILIDGLPISDPSAISNDYDLRLLDANIVESIEVLKGGASTQYGTGAAAGVINITLKEPSTPKPELTLSQQVGSFNMLNTNALVQGRKFNFGYLASFNIGVTEGISAAEDNDPTTVFDNDGVFNYSGRLKLSMDDENGGNRSLNLSYDRYESDYDDGAFTDANNIFTLNQLNIGFKNTFVTPKGTTTLSTSFNRMEREFESRFPSESQGNLFQFETIRKRNPNSWLNYDYGLLGQYYFFKTDDDNPETLNTGVYINGSAVVNDELTINGGLRYTIYNRSLKFNKLVYNFNPVYTQDLGNNIILKLFGSYSTAFVAPTLFQIGAPGFGNGSLDAEETASLEFGTSLYLGNTLTVNLEYFDREEENAIDFVSLFDINGNWIGGTYDNIAGTREISGIELDLEWQVNSSFQVSGHFTDYKFGDPTQFYRIPDQKYGMKANYSFNERTNIQVNFTHFGERQAAIFSDPFLVTLDGYDLVDLSFSHQFEDSDIVLSGAINNLFDEDFVGIYGFATRPINFTIRLSAKF